MVRAVTNYVAVNGLLQQFADEFAAICGLFFNASLVNKRNKNQFRRAKSE